MSDRLATIESQVETTHKTVEGFTVDAGTVEEFARAIKNSGNGRDLSSAGLKEFANRKTVWIE